MTKSTKRESAPKTVDFECKVFKQGKHQLILFLAKAKQLYSVVSANQLQPDKDQGYQRVVSPSRKRKIGAFIDAGNPLPLSVLISFDHAKLSADHTILHVPNRPDSGWVIDGQHRLAGAHEAKADIILPVVAFNGLDIKEQVSQFVTINREQVGVPTSLYYELLSRLPNTLTEKQLLEERATDLAKQLRRDAESPFFNRIVLKPNPTLGQISTTNFVRKIAPYLKRDGGCLFIYTDDERKRLLSNYYNAIRATHPKEFDKRDSVFFKTVGFGAMINALPTVLQLSIHLLGGLAVDDMTKLFSNITEWDPVSWRELGTGSAAEKRAGDDLLTLLYQLREGQPQSSGIRM